MKEQEREKRILRKIEEFNAAIRKLKKMLPHHKRDPETNAEITFRDWLCGPVSRTLKKLGISANTITLLGVAIVTIQNILLWYGFVTYSLACAVCAILSDAIDGPRARLKDPETGKDEVTGFGTLMDHVRDYYEALSLGIPAFFYKGQFTALDSVLFFFIILSYAIIGLKVCYRYLLFPQQTVTPRLFRMRDRIRLRWRNCIAFSKEHLQTEYWGRVQFTLLACAVIIMFIGRIHAISSLIHLSYIIFGGELLAGYINLKKTASEPEEE